MLKKIITYLLLVSSAPSWACTCEELKPLTNEVVAEYDVVFRGKVIAVSGCEDKFAKAHFQVEKVYKGKFYTETDVEFDCVTSCAMQLLPGETWMIYGDYISYGTPRTWFCSHSRKWVADSTQDYSSLGRPSFGSEEKWLQQNLGEQEFIEKDAVPQRHRNDLPDQKEFFIYMIAGLIGGVGIFWGVKKMFGHGKK